MKLRSKKTGYVGDFDVKSIKDGGEFIRVMDSNAPPSKIKIKCGTLYYYDSLADLNEEWEDYAPAEPLIKDEKIRKAIRAWADMNDIRFIHMCSRARKENARIVGQNAVGRTFTMEISNEYEIRICFKDYKECYTVNELCGAEE